MSACLAALFRSVCGRRRRRLLTVVCLVLLAIAAVRRLTKDGPSADGHATTTHVTPPADTTPRDMVMTSSRDAGDDVTEVDVQEVVRSAVGLVEQSGAMSALVDGLRAGADVNGTVMISVVDGKFADFAFNFYTTATRLNLSSVLLCVDRDATVYLRSRQVPCVPFYVRHAVDGAGDFGTLRYNGVTNLKTLAVLCTLHCGYDALVVDVDVSLFADPRPHFRCGACDVHVQMDRAQANSGFAHVRRTPGGVRLYARAWRMYTHYRRASDQTYLNSAMDVLRRDGRLRVRELPVDRFACGYYYFEYDGRHFYNEPPCPGCVMAHSNYIGTVAAKRYRLRENLLWRVEEDGYYTSRETRYLVYDNPYDLAERAMHLEKTALTNAFHLARLTGRVVILPSFRCCDCSGKVCASARRRCSLLSVLDVKRFEAAVGRRYREHSFLRHPLVEVRLLDASEVLVINTTFYRNRSVPDARPAAVFQSARARGVNTTELLAWLERFRSSSVLRFHSLYDVFTDVGASTDFTDRSFNCTSYEQWQQQTLDDML